MVRVSHKNTCKWAKNPIVGYIITARIKIIPKLTSACPAGLSDDSTIPACSPEDSLAPSTLTRLPPELKTEEHVLK